MEPRVQFQVLEVEHQDESRCKTTKIKNQRNKTDRGEGAPREEVRQTECSTPWAPRPGGAKGRLPTDKCSQTATKKKIYT